MTVGDERMRLTNLLIETWERAESGPLPLSHVATFRDMATAALDSWAEQLPIPDPEPPISSTQLRRVAALLHRACHDPCPEPSEGSCLSLAQAFRLAGAVNRVVSSLVSEAWVQGAVHGGVPGFPFATASRRAEWARENNPYGK